MPVFTPPQTPQAQLQSLRQQVSAIPAAAGVYLFMGSTGLPLYIGKSINLRSRLLSHLRTPEEAKLLQQTLHIEYQLTAGELGALLLESQLIKQHQPLYNKRLRKTRRLCSWRLDGHRLTPVSTTQPDSQTPLYGLFRNQHSALQALRLLADEQGLCLARLGIEKDSRRACFRAQINKCRGVCCQRESTLEHDLRLHSTLADWQVQHWPFAGAVALHEQAGPLNHYHVINQWHYLGTYPELEQAQAAPQQPPQAFDADSYKILLRPLLSHDSQILLLPS